MGGVWQRKDNIVMKASGRVNVHIAHAISTKVGNAVKAVPTIVPRTGRNRPAPGWATLSRAGKPYPANASYVNVVEEDTAKYARVDMGKIKIFTHHMAAINQVMRLLVGSIPFDIRVVEDQVVFICNSDFRCGCLCHVREDEHTLSTNAEEDDDDVAGMEVDQPLEDDSSISVSVGADSQIDSCAPRDGIAIGNANAGGDNLLEPLPVTGPGPIWPTSPAYEPLVQDALHVDNRVLGIESSYALPISYQHGPVFNPAGINLEVVLGNPLVNSNRVPHSLIEVVPHSDTNFERIRSPAVDSHPGEKRDRALRVTHSPVSSDYAIGTMADQSTRGLDHTQTDLGVSSGAEGIEDGGPRKRGLLDAQGKQPLFAVSAREDINEKRDMLYITIINRAAARKKKSLPSRH
ncbi:hypothetical protein Dimus_034023 [Dionaea muscipula]